MRYQITETPKILGKFNTGDTVTITLYDLSDESSETLTSNACNELGSTGVFYWSTSNITTQPTAFTEYCWVMTNGTTSQYGKIVLGGYPDNCDSPISDITVDNAAIADAVWDETLYEHIKANSVGEKFNNFNAGISFDYQEIRKIVEQEINKISDSLPKSEKVDLSEIVKKLDNAQEAIEEKLNKKDINVTYDIANSIKEWEKASKEIRDKSVENLRKMLEREAIISSETIIEKTEKRANELSSILSDTTKSAKEQLSGFDQAIKEVVDREMIKFTEQIKETVDKLIEQISKPITLNYAIEEDEEDTDNKENRINNMMKYV